jgi:DNA-binding NarL/FixJ family response regulator
VVREGLQALLTSEEDIEIIGVADNGRDAAKLAERLKPKVVVMDLAMPLLNGIEATRQIMENVSETKVLVLSSYGDEISVTRAMKAGAAGFLIKQTAAGDLVRAIREVTSGNVYFSPSTAQRLCENCVAAAKAEVEGALNGEMPLSGRQVEVLQLLAEGLPNKAIAIELCISIKTVEKHRHQLMDKLDLHRVATLTRYAVAQRVVSWDDGGVAAAHQARA